MGQLRTLFILVSTALSFSACENMVTQERGHKMAPESPAKEEQAAPPVVKESTDEEKLMQWTAEQSQEYCVKSLSALPGKYKKADVVAACAQAARLPGCHSREGKPIFHYDRAAKVLRNGKVAKSSKNILTLSLIHGDELPSGSVARSWMERLETLDPRNRWRVLPIVNPDGLKRRTRTNAAKVDINRNFPTLDWDEKALHHWRVDKKADPRRYPGPKGGSEVETQCLIQHIADFKPDFIISIHTPLGVLDFDGPKKLKFPKFRPLPWISLGNFPGSLGRYSWTDRNVPVLTIELKGHSGVQRLEMFDRLQDISGTVAIQASKVKKKRRNKRDRLGQKSKSKKRRDRG